MSRVSLLSFFVVIGGTAVFLAGTAQSQSGVPKNQVVLQPSTPGTSQSGHSNISGTSRAGQFVGGGAGLTSVNADLLDGLNSTSFLQAVPNPLSLTGTQSGSILSGTNASGSLGSAGVIGRSSATTGATIGVLGTNSSVDGRGVFGRATSTTGPNYGGYFENQSTAGGGIYAVANSSSGNTVAGRFENSSTSGRGILGHATSEFGMTLGVVGESDSEEGKGVSGVTSATWGTTYGGYFESSASNGPAGGGYGVYAVSAGPYGVYGVSNRQSDGFGGYFVSNGGSGAGLVGVSSGPGSIAVIGNNSAPTGATYGGSFTSDSPDGYGLFGGSFTGIAGVLGSVSSTSGVNYGGWFDSPSIDGRGVYGHASTAVVGSTPYGVLGQANTATNGFGVYALGDSGASGVKSFRIDHPADPANKYLLHYSSESPFPQNFYNGIATTDRNGFAWVDLPDYFQEVNTNFKYQLTVIGKSFAQAIISEEIKGNRFQIQTNKPGIKVSWEVKADRNDARVRFKRPQDVVDKMGSEQGTYQHPEYYNQSERSGMGNRAFPKLDLQPIENSKNSRAQRSRRS